MHYVFTEVTRSSNGTRCHDDSHKRIIDDGTIGPCKTIDELLERLCEEFSVTHYDGRITPEILTATSNSNVPFSALDDAEKEATLEDMVQCHIDIDAIAADAVAAEQELHDSEKYTPCDAHPLDSDHHDYDMRDALREVFNPQAFDNDVWDGLEHWALEQVRDEVADQWDEREKEEEGLSELFG